MSGVNFGPLKSFVAFEVHQTWKAIRKRLLADVRKGTARVRRGSYSIPIMIDLNPGISPQELARALKLDASKVALFLRQLEGQGFVHKVPDTQDRRKVGLHLTDQGKAYAAEAMAASELLETPFLSAITPEERAELSRILTKIQDSI